MNKIIRYYVQGHTGKGYVNYIGKNLQGIKLVVLLRNKETIVITAILKEVMKRYKHEEIEVINSIKNKNLIEGIIIRGKTLAILNEEIYDGPRESARIVPLDVHVNNLLTSPKKQASSIYDKAYACFAEGLNIHEQLESIYIKEMNFKKADKIIDNILAELFNNVKDKQGESIVYERLFGTNTPDGIVNTVPSLIAPINNKIFILGRAGTGKSYLMNKVLEKCLELGIDVELYRCSLDPNSIDMLIIREIDVCIHDNTSPHVVAMDYSHKKIYDMYKETVNQSTEKDNEIMIKHLQSLYKEQMKKGLQLLKKQQKNIDHLFEKLNNVDLTPNIKKIFKKIH